MYSASHPVSTSMNGVSGNLVDSAGTINPAALDPAGKSYSPPRATVLGVGRPLPTNPTRPLGEGDRRGRFVSDPGLTRRIMNLVLSHPSAVLSGRTSPRGIKRSRSQDSYGDLPLTGDGADGNGGWARHPYSPTARAFR